MAVGHEYKDTHLGAIMIVGEMVNTRNVHTPKAAYLASSSSSEKRKR